MKTLAVDLGNARIALNIPPVMCNMGVSLKLFC